MNKFFRNTFIVLFSIYTTQLLSSNYSFTDQYNSCVNSSFHDTDLILCLDLKSYEYSNLKPEIGIQLAKKALEISNSINWLKGKALANNEMAVNYKAIGNLDSAEYYYLNSLHYFEKMRNVKSQSAVMTNISTIYKAKGDYLKALDYLKKALSIQNTNKMPSASAITLENIGTIYLELNQFEIAKSYYQNAKNINIKLGDKENIARNTLNLGILYDKYGKFDSAILNFNSALKLNLSLNKPNSIQLAYSNLGISYMHLENFNSAIHCHNKAIQYSKQLKSDFSLAIDHGNIGEVYYKLFQKNNSNTDLNKAIHFLSLGYYGCQKIGMSPPQIEFGEKLVEALEKTKKDFHLAFNILKEIEQLKDSIYSKDNSLKIQQLESKYQLNQKESELLLLNLKNKLFIKENIRHMHHKTILILVVIIITLVLTLLYFLFINKSKIYKRRMFEISQFQSHQLRSTAVKISALVEELNSDGISNEEHDKLLTMLTQSATELDLHIHNIVKKAK